MFVTISSGKSSARSTTATEVSVTVSTELLCIITNLQVNRNRITVTQGWYKGKGKIYRTALKERRRVFISLFEALSP